MCVHIYTRYWFIFFCSYHPKLFYRVSNRPGCGFFWWGFWEVRGDSLKLWRRWCAAPSRHSGWVPKDLVKNGNLWAFEASICGHAFATHIHKKETTWNNGHGGNYGFDQWSRQVSSNRIQWYPVPPSSELRRSSSAGFRDGITGFDLVLWRCGRTRENLWEPIFPRLGPPMATQNSIVPADCNSRSGSQTGDL